MEEASVMLETERSEEPVPGLLAAPRSDSPSTILTLIERIALEPGADGEKLERMIAMYKRSKAKEAELAYNAAKGRILKSSPASRLSRPDPPYAKSGTGRKRVLMKPSNTRLWRRSTNICVRCWRQRKWISPVPMSRRRTAAS